MPAAPVVLDSHALVAYFRDEPGAQYVEALLTKAASSEHSLHMTQVNYAEVKYALIRKDGPQAWAAAARILSGLPIDFHPADRRLADAFAAALASEKKGELVTGDPEFKALEKEIKIDWPK